MKELPYFKFYTNEWITGDITFLDYETQGLFINLCAYYWSKDANLTLTNAKRKFKDVKNESFELLIESDIIKINEDNIIIKFLDEQREERGKLSTTNSLNGAKGGRPKKQTESENKPNALNLESETITKKSNIEEKRREKKRTIPTIEEFLAYALANKPNVDTNDVRLKYESWKVNDWCVNRDGKINDIKNWKSTLLNTLPFFKEVIINKKSIEQLQYENVMRQMESNK